MGKYIDFAYVKEHADFAKVLDAFDVELFGQGNERRARCPFHDDEEPSMTVNLERGLFNCFAASCGMKGNVLDFVAEIDECSLRGAALAIAEICNIGVAAPKQKKNDRGYRNKRPRSRSADRKPEPKAEQDVPDWDEISGHVPRQEEESEPVTEPIGDEEINIPLSFRLKLDPDHRYGRSRGLSSAIISQFQMGFCNRGIMRNRWCVPIHNEHSELVAYIGRWVDDELPKGETRYKLPTDFAKNRVLFNLNRVLDAFMLTENALFLVEGVFDAIRLHELGIPAVALMGTSVSDEQLELLCKFNLNLIVMMDGGKPGNEAADRLVTQLAPGFFVRNVVLAKGQDPASLPERLLLGVAQNCGVVRYQEQVA